MKTTQNNPFTGWSVEVQVPGQRFTLTPAQRAAIKATLGKGESIPLKMKSNGGCVVAESLGRALGGEYSPRNRHEKFMVVTSVTIGSGTFRLNSRARPSFGVDKTGNIVAIVRLIEQDGDHDHDRTRWTITWFNAAIPRAFSEIANHHDLTEDYRGTTEVLKFDDAVIVRRRWQPDNRPNDQAARDRKNNHRAGREFVAGADRKSVPAKKAAAPAKKSKTMAAPVETERQAKKMPRTDTPPTSTVERKHRRPTCLDLDLIYK